MASIARSRPRARRASADEELTPALIPHVIPLLAWDPVADDAIRALRQVRPRHVGTLVRRAARPIRGLCRQAANSSRVGRLPLAACRRQPAAGTRQTSVSRSASSAGARWPRSSRNSRTCASTRPASSTWCRKRSRSDGRSGKAGACSIGWTTASRRPFVDEFIRSRASQSLAHVFTHAVAGAAGRAAADRASRPVRRRSEPSRDGARISRERASADRFASRSGRFSKIAGRPANVVRGQDDILADLVRSNHSIMLNLEELKRRARRRGCSMRDMDKTIEHKKTAHRAARTDAHAWAIADDALSPGTFLTISSTSRSSGSRCSVSSEWCSGRPAW